MIGVAPSCSRIDRAAAPQARTSGTDGPSVSAAVHVAHA